MNVMTIEKLQSIFTKKGYVWNANLNIIGVRNKSVGDKITNKFDDTLYIAYKESGVWKIKSYAITTDPGTYYMKNPLNSKGCAILVEGQYLNSHILGLHQGKYMALVQRGTLSVYRDVNKNDIYDYSTKDTGAGFGINIHKSGIDSLTIDSHSAGCQVFKKVSDFNDFLTIATNYKTILGNKYTYTLINSYDTI